MQENPPEHRRVSYSSFSVWATCPYQWKLRYVDGIREGGSIHTVFGTAIHEAIQEWLQLRFNVSEFKAKIFDIEDFFKERLLTLFKEEIKHDADGHPTYLCDQSTLREFYSAGVEILRHVQQHRDQYFPSKGYELIGCEVPLEVALSEGIQFNGYIDIVIRHKRTGEIFIFDLKTSKRGWFYEKKDPIKINQLLLYKSFYAQQFDVDIEKVTVQFIILKREINENSEWTQSRISKFEPSQGKISVKKALTSFESFVNAAFRPDGQIKEDNLTPTPSEKNCRWCFFRGKPELCAQSYYSTPK
jgi:hypothetical protein